MFSVLVRNLSPGLVLCRDITNDDGVVLYSKDTILTQDIIDNLRILFSWDKSVDVYGFNYIKPKLCRDVLFARKYIDWIINQVTSNSKGTGLDMVSLSKSISDFLIENRDILSSLIMIKYNHDYTFSHCINVALISCKLGIDLGLDSNSINDLVLGAVLHDLGKIQIPLHILDKPASLTDDEFSIVKQHPLDGCDIIVNTDIPQNAYDIVCQHHEKMDGTGYPFGLKGSQINPLSRIVTVADIFDAITSERVYHKPKSQFLGALDIDNIAKKRQVDKSVSTVLLNAVLPYKLNSYVKLSDGNYGVVVGLGDDIRRPKVYLPGSNSLLDLSTNHNIEVIEVYN